MMELQWRTITQSNSPKYLVNGTELEQALVGPHNRYALIAVRSHDKEGYSDIEYLIRDAETVSDADVRLGKRPAIVGRTKDWSKVEKFLADQQKLIEEIEKEC